MSHSFIRPQTPRSSIAPGRLSKSGQPGTTGKTPSDVQVAEAHLRSPGPSGSREKLNSFLSKLETTWKLFNKSSTASGEGELPKEGNFAFLEEGETPTPETLKNLRARFKQQAQKPDKGGSYLFKATTPEKKAEQKQAATSSAKGPKESPHSDRNTPKAPTPRTPAPPPQGKSLSGKSSSKAEAARQKEVAGRSAPQQKSPPAPTRSQEGHRLPTFAASSPADKKMPQEELRKEQKQQEPAQKGERPKQSSTTTRGAVLGRRPGTAAAAKSKPAATPKQNTPAPPSQKGADGGGQSSLSTPMGQRRPQLLRTPGPRPQGPAGTATSRSFLGMSTQGGAQLRTSDPMGKPGRATVANSQAVRSVFSHSVAQIGPGLTRRHVCAQMPVHNSFLDECHESESKDSGPIKLSWTSAKKTARTPAQRMFAHRQRLPLSRHPAGGKSLGSPISMARSPGPSAAARADVGTRIAGAAIGTLLKDLYEEEDVEKLDEETAVTSLGLILRLGGEFTYNHSTRVLDLAMELADEVGIKDKKTRKEIKFGAMFRDIGEFDLLLQGETSVDQRMKEFSGFLAGQDMLRAGLLHDIGKVQIPSEILYKPGKLTAEEYELMKMHPIFGEEIVRRIASLRYLCPTIRGHHERWDGKGYPDGLSGEDIPLAARIISVADVFDALAAERPYKRGMEVEKVKAILSEGRDSHFDPFLVDAFLGVLLRRYPKQ